MQVWRAFIVVLSLTAANCGPAGRYQLTWTLGCADDVGPCTLDNARQCAASGIDMVEVLTVNSSEETKNRTLFQCFAPQYGEEAISGPAGLGPALDEGDYTLVVYTLNAAGRRLADAAPSVPITIVADKITEATVDLPVPPQCSDGVDNDGDGLVDLFDPNCDELQDASEQDTPET